MNEKGKIQIDTALNNKELVEGYKGISKQTDKLIKQFDSKLSKLKKEQIQVDTLKAKYNQLASGAKAPASLTAMETQLNKLIGRSDKLNNEYSTLMSDGMKESDPTAQKIASEMDLIEEKVNNLKPQLENLRLNPTASQEAINLKTQIEYLENELQDGVREANEMSNAIEMATKKDFSKLSKGIKGFAGVVAKSVNGTVNKNFDKLNSKVDKFKNKMTRLALTAMVFSLIRRSLSSLSSGLMGMLKSNDKFASSLNQIKANLMTAFAPIYNAVLPAINALMSGLSTITGTIAQFTSGLFGKSIDESKAMAKSLDKQAKSYGKVADAQKDVEKAASFDKLETVSEESSGGSNSELDFSGAVHSSGELLGFLNEIKELASSGKWYEMGELLASGINSGLEKIDVKGFFKKTDTVVKNFAKSLNGFVDKLDWALLAKKFGDGVKGIIKNLVTLISTIDWQSIGNAIGTFLLGIDWGGVAIGILELIISLIIGALDLLSGLIDALMEKLADPNLLGDIFNFGAQLIVSLVNGAISVLAKVTDVVGKLLSIFAKLLGLEEIWKAISKFAVACFNDIVEVFSGLWTMFVDFVIDPLVNVFNGLWDTLVRGAQGAWDGIKWVFSTVASFFSNIFGAAWNNVKNIFSTGGQVFMGIVDGIVNAFTSIVNALIGGLNTIVRVPFDAVNGVLNWIRNIDLPLIGKPFKGFWSQNPIPVPQIPYLATGAVIPPNAQFAAILGDQKHGKNLEAPESLIRQIVREESGNREIVLNPTFIVQCDEIELAKASLEGIRMMEDINNAQYLVE